MKTSKLMVCVACLFFSQVAWCQTSGLIVVNFNIVVQSPISLTQPITCSVSLQATEVNLATQSAGIFQETKTKVATRTSQTAATCAVSVPYSWNLLTPLADKMGINITVSEDGDSPITQRMSMQSIGTIPLPSNNATTTENVQVVF